MTTAKTYDITKYQIQDLQGNLIYQFAERDKDKPALIYFLARHRGHRVEWGPNFYRKRSLYSPTVAQCKKCNEKLINTAIPAVVEKE
jgi:hypothetical protein